MHLQHLWSTLSARQPHDALNVHFEASEVAEKPQVPSWSLCSSHFAGQSSFGERHAVVSIPTAPL